MDVSVEKIAQLARLELEPQEKEKIRKELSAILDYVKKLDRLDTAHVAPTSHVLNLENVFRPDQVCPSEVRDEALEHAPAREGYFFKVPKIVDR